GRPFSPKGPRRGARLGGGPFDPAAHALCEPARSAPMFRLELLIQHGTSQRLRQQGAIAGDEPAGLGEPSVGADKVRPRQAVTVEEHDVVAARFTDRAVANLAGAETAVLVPDMGEPHAEPWLPLLDQRRRR